MNQTTTSCYMPSALQTIAGHEDIDLFDEGFGGRMRLTERYGRNPNPTAGSPRYDFKDLASAANDKTGWSGRSRPLSMPSIPSTLRPEQIDQEPGVSHLGDMQQTWYNTQPSSPTSSPNTGLYNGNPFASSSGICYDSMWSTTRAISYNSLGALSGVDEYRADVKAPLFVCKWEGCSYTRGFNREMDLIRHVRSLHISPGSYRCCVRRCSKIFNRKDKLKEHLDKAHSDQL